jgi:hypothetical protein
MATSLTLTPPLHDLGIGPDVRLIAVALRTPLLRPFTERTASTTLMPARRVSRGWLHGCLARLRTPPAREQGETLPTSWRAAGSPSEPPDHDNQAPLDVLRN